jgi:CheY-like chemotaxis protein
MHDPVRLLVVGQLGPGFQSLCRALSDDGAAHIVANPLTERAARAALGSTRVDVVALDVKLDAGSGLGVLEHLQGLPPPVPTAVVVTSYAFPEFETACRMRGAAAFLDKTRDLTPFVELVRERMQRNAPRK